MTYHISLSLPIFPAPSDALIIKVPESSTEILQFTCSAPDCVQISQEYVTLLPVPTEIFAASTQILSVIINVVSVIEVFNNFVGAKIVTKGASISIINVTLVAGQTFPEASIRFML
jgi:hypothetical protein